ncbi:AMP-binding protein, partial [Rhizobiaceae sp. 2RAB30]
MEWPASDLVAHHARSQPDRLACLDLATERRWSYAQLDIAIQRAVTTLRRRYDIRPGQRVAVIARNSADLLILQQAATRIGAIFVPINWRLAPPEQSRILADCTPRLLVRGQAMTPPEWPDDCRAVAHSVLAEQIRADEPADRLPCPPADAPSIILYTSGTSGRPKGVVISERAMLATAINFGILAKVGQSSVFLCDTPMFHVR